MTEQIRAFFVITVLMALAFLISKRLFSHAVEPKFVERMFGAGYGATCVMFFAPNIWLFLGGLATLSALAAKRFKYPLALFVFLLLLMPGYSVAVPGFGLINYLLELNPWRVLVITILVPVSLYLLGQQHLPMLGKLLTDKLVIGFVLCISVLNYLHNETFTGGLRQLATSTLDMVLLYFVASRGLIMKKAVRHVMVALVMGATFLALVGFFEFSKHWILYASLKEKYGINTLMFGYLSRGDTLRASATTGQAIVLGFVMMVALLISTYVQTLIQPGLNRSVLKVLMMTGLVAAMSRGPWVGAVIGLFVTALASSDPLRNILKLMMAGLSSAILLFMLPGGEKIIDYLPWIGTIDSANIAYREMLWEQAKIVIKNNVWIGSIGYRELPEFDVIRQGGGAIDIVNSYVGIALSYGMIGLFLYASIIFLPIFMTAKSNIRASSSRGEYKAYGAALLGASSAVAITITTVSSISHIGLIVSLMVGAGVAYANANCNFDAQELWRN